MYVATEPWGWLIAVPLFLIVTVIARTTWHLGRGVALELRPDSLIEYEALSATSIPWAALEPGALEVPRGLDSLRDGLRLAWHALSSPGHPSAVAHTA